MILYELSDTSYAAKLVAQHTGQPVAIGSTYFDDQGQFYYQGLLK